MHRFFRLFFYLCVTTHVSGQALIPFLDKTGLYGLADTTGKLVLEPRFTEMPYSARKYQGFYSVQTQKGLTQHFLISGAPMIGSGNQAFAQLFAGSKTVAIGSLGQLLCFVGFDTLSIVHLGNGRQWRWPARENKSCALGFDTHYPCISPVGFHFGYLRIREGNGFNMLDTTLQKVFSAPVPAVTMVDAETMLVGNTAGKVGIADRSGKMLTEYNWDVLVPCQGADLFIANTPVDRCGLPNANGSVYAINRKGETVLGPGYKDVYGAGGGLVVTDSAGNNALFNEKGGMVLPFAAQRISSYTPGVFLIYGNQGRYLMDIKGNILVQPGYDLIEYASAGEGREGCYWGRKTSGGVDVFDADFKVVMRDTTTHQVWLRKVRGKLIYLFAQTARNSPNGVKVYNHKHQQVLTAIDVGQVEPFLRDEYLKFSNTSRRLSGICDAEGNVLLAMEFEELRYAMAIDTQRTVLFGRRQGGTLWESFWLPDCKPTGWEPSLSAEITESSRNLINRRWEVRQGKVILPDGRAVPFPAHWGVHPNVHVAESPKGLIVAFQNKEKKFEILNAQGKDLIPKGYKACMPFFIPAHMERSGLVAVVSDNYQPVVAQRHGGNGEQKSSRPPADGSGLGSGAPDQEVQAVSGTISCGVLNALGEWVIEPTTERSFIPYSYNLIGAYDAWEAKEYKQKPKELHILNTNKSRILKVAFVEGHDEPSFKTIIAVVQYDGNDAKETGYMRSAWFDRSGNQLTDFTYQYSMGNLERNSLVWQIRGKEKILTLLSPQGKVLKELDWAAPNALFRSMYGGYTALQNKTGEYCLLDSLGQIALPFRKEKLEFESQSGTVQVLYQDTISATQIKQRRALLHPNGTLLLNQFQSFVRTYQLDNGEIGLLLNFEADQKTDAGIRTGNLLLVLNNQRKVKWQADHFNVQELRQMGTTREYFIGHSLVQEGKPVLYCIDAETGVEFRAE